MECVEFYTLRDCKDPGILMNVGKFKLQYVVGV